jgi:hypothetical protein
MNTTICSSLVLILVLILLYQIFKIRTVDAIIINTLSILIVAIVMFMFIHPSKEAYENISPNNQLITFEGFIKKYNIANEEELKDILIGNYNEDLTPIYNSNMTLYYSIFSNNSYKFINKKIWYNISPYFETFIMKDCPTRKQIDFTHLNLDNISVENIDRFNGVYVADSIIYGPPSYQLGFEPTGFSVIIVFRFEKLEISTTGNMNIYHIFANTTYNNAIDISIINESIRTDQNGKYTFKLSIRFANDNILISNDIEINIKNVQLISVIKDNLSLNVSIIDMVENVEIKVFQVTLNEIHKTDMLLSNKNLSINESKNCFINIFAFAIFNQAIIDKMYLIKYFSIELYKISAEFKQLASAFLSSRTISKACPYDEKTCRVCNNITDWQNRDMSKFTPECLAAINEACIKNPALPYCQCWSKANEDSIQCRQYKAVFDRTLDVCPKKIIAQEIVEQEIIQNKNTCDTIVKCMDTILDKDDWDKVDKSYVELYEKGL